MFTIHELEWRHNTCHWKLTRTEMLLMVSTHPKNMKGWCNHHRHRHPHHNHPKCNHNRKLTIHSLYRGAVTGPSIPYISYIIYIYYVYNTRRFHSNYSQSWPKPLHAPLLRSRSKSQVLSFQSPRVVNPAMKTRGPFFLFGTNKYSVNNHHIVNKTSLVGGFKILVNGKDYPIYYGT